MDSQDNRRSPDYSAFAGEYAHSRPGYPEALFSYLASLVDRHRMAWDCATGNGQAAIELARSFDTVIATDISTEQIQHAVPHAQIEYRVAVAEQSGLEDSSVDLVTVASAVHWFNLERFYEEVRRTVRPGGVLAVWTYHVAYLDPPFHLILQRFYRNVVSPYFAPGAKLVDDRYKTITLPGNSIEAANYYMSADWKFDQMLAFIRSWSGTQQYTKERGEDPVSLIAGELEELWGNRETHYNLRWPLYLRISRL